jgi:hypothetical protein
MTTFHKKTFLGGITTFLGLVFLIMAVTLLRIAVESILEFSFFIAGYLGLVCVAAFGITGLCTILLGVVLLHGHKRRKEV